MRKFLVVITVLLVVFVVLARQRLFMRDPLAIITRDGTKVANAHASINYSNDVLLYDDSAGRSRTYLIQNWNKTLIAPARLMCVTKLACLTDADHASGDPITPGRRVNRSPTAGVSMSDRVVSFVDEDGALVEVTLR